MNSRVYIALVAFGCGLGCICAAAAFEYSDALLDIKDDWEAGAFQDCIEGLKEAAERGDERAQLLYGLAFDYGLGLSRDEDRARFWLSQADRAGLVEATSALWDLNRSNEWDEDAQLS